MQKPLALAVSNRFSSASLLSPPLSAAQGDRKVLSSSAAYAGDHDVSLTTPFIL